MENLTKAYHGSRVQNLVELIPFANPDSNLDFACVYLTKILPLAPFYIWDKPYKWMNYGFNADGRVEYTESFPNALEEFYGGLSGSIYECLGQFEDNPNTKVPTAVISREKIIVRNEIIVDDALEYILRQEYDGNIIIHKYENLSEEHLKCERRMILSVIKNQNLITTESPYKDFIIEKFPAIWEEAIRLLDENAYGK
jgi:hypothetical protein